MQALNLTLLNTSTVYIRQENERNLGGRSIHRFLLVDSNSQETLTAAATCITGLLAANPKLLFVSRPVPPKTLQQKVAECNYLVINGYALCLTNKEKAPDNIDILCRDFFFSEAILNEPVQCSKGHTFERANIAAWVASKGNKCPHSDHEVGPIAVDYYILDRIRVIIAAHEGQAEENRDARERIERAEESILVHSARVSVLQAQIKPKKAWEIAGGATKVTFKVSRIVFEEMSKKAAEKAVEKGAEKLAEKAVEKGAEKLAEKAVEKGAEKLAEKAVEKVSEEVTKKTLIDSIKPAVVKSVPFLPAVFGVLLALRRLHNEEYFKAVGELVSGAAGCFPGFGTALSILIDGVILWYDVNGEAKIEMDVVNAHKTLSLDPNTAATKKDVDEAFTKMSFLAHPDRVQQFGELTQKELDDLQAVLTQCKDKLYKHYNW